VDLYLEKRKQEGKKEDCEDLFKFMNIGELDEKDQELNKAIESRIENSDNVD